MSNVSDKAFEIAKKQTHEWVDQMLAKGIPVSEYHMGAKFTVFYEAALEKVKIDALNF